MTDCMTWQEAAFKIGRASAERITRERPFISDALLNEYLETLGGALCERMLSAGVPHAEIETTLDLLAETFAARLDQLDAASQQPAGRA